MSITKYEPANQLGNVRSLRNEIDRLFDEFSLPFAPLKGSFFAPLGGWEAARKAFTPGVNLSETDDAFTLTAEVPGMTKDSLDVTVTEDSVILKGERKEEKEEKGEQFHYRESSYGSFERVVQLPGTVDVDKVDAKMKDGVLTLTMAKAERTKKRGIKIEEA